ncbi:MAG: divalent-cation tolerance protein CutA [Candidatus Babeliales bacterium]|nr:divalent-cation tolerance protein CutA [Candidatus Babeliales bacterium]
MNKIILFYVPVSNLQEAEKISENLLKNKLIACANVLAATSFYVWQNEFKNDSEFIMLIKTLEEQADKVSNEIEKLHSYSTPCIGKTYLEVNTSYFNWVKEQINFI